MLPPVYEELRELAAARMASEKPGRTPRATALVHEAWLRPLGPEKEAQSWDGRRHFLGAAAEAMRRILVDRARRKHGSKPEGRAGSPLPAVSVLTPAISRRGAAREGLRGQDLRRRRSASCPAARWGQRTA